MPSLLHVLDVDKHARSKQSEPSTDASIDELMRREYENGGMNWGTIVLYTCKDCCKSREDFLVVQDSVDGQPEKRAGPTADAMVTDACDDNDEEYADDDTNNDLEDDDDFDDNED